MGYFSNGTEGAMFEHKYCSRCVHENTEKGCPVMMAHVLFAYKLCNEKDNEGKQILDLLIPESENGLGNEQCAMFHLKKDAADPEQFKLPL